MKRVKIIGAAIGCAAVAAAAVLLVTKPKIPAEITAIETETTAVSETTAAEITAAEMAVSEETTAVVTEKKLSAEPITLAKIEATAPKETVAAVAKKAVAEPISGTYYCTVSSVNKRETPDAQAQSLGKIDYGEAVEVSGKIAENGYIWYKTADGGFVVADYFSAKKPPVKPQKIEVAKSQTLAPAVKDEVVPYNGEVDKNGRPTRKGKYDGEIVEINGQKFRWDAYPNGSGAWVRYSRENKENVGQTVVRLEGGVQLDNIKWGS